MKKFKNFIFLGMMLFISAGAFAQQKTANISFDRKSYDFGKIMEEKGNVTYKFSFINTGGVPLIINNVQASCGCTTPDWTKSPVLPGQKGFVSATYNPAGRPGPFEKTISITSNSEPSVSVVTIKGEVLAKAKGIEDIYPDLMGDLRLKSRYISFARVFVNEKKTQKVEIVNVSSVPVKITLSSMSKYIDVKAVPATLKPKQQGIIEITFDASLIKEFGFVSDRIALTTNDKPNANSALTVSASIEEDFSKLSEKELAEAPSMDFSSDTYNFGDLVQGKRVEHEFTFTNNGKKDLIIRKIKASCGCTTVDPRDMVIKPGASSSIKAIFDSTGKMGSQSKSITVITNDPKKTTLYLWLKGNVVNK
jgi:hypothetical protein